MRKLSVFLYLFFCSSFLIAQNTDQKVDKLLYLVKKLHVSPPEYNKAFAEKVVNSFVFDLDRQCRIFYSKDIEALRQIQTNEPDARNIICLSFRHISSVYVTRVKETDSIISSFGNKKMAWQKNQLLQFNDDYINNYPKTNTQKTESIDKWIKLYMLRHLEVAEKLEKDFEFEKNPELKQRAITKLAKEITKITSDQKNITVALEECLLQSVMAACDPHSDYFTPKEKTDFTASLSTSVESYGFSVEQNDEDRIEIASIKPGSPAWKCNALNAGDQITQVAFKNKKAIDVTEMEGDDFEEMMSKSTEKEMDMAVLKKNGSIEKVHLVKAFVQSEDNVINSYILSKTIPIGYIPLPSFYTDFSDLTASGCANDVAKEIIKLKGEGIQGLILDLRNNGGGSLEEAINLAGIFIDIAPLCIEKIRSQKPVVLKDFNRGSIYDGPVVVLINNVSASASELLAMMLKTHHRAIIAGNNSFGKATGQIVVPLDTTVAFNPVAKKNYNERDGFVKITIEKLYNLNGTTHQAAGVEPHIRIPDLWDKIPYGEKDLANVLPADVIDKKVAVTAVPDEKISACAEKSAQRIAADPLFKRVASLADTFRIEYDKEHTMELYPPAFAALLKYDDKLDSILENSIYAADSSFVVSPNKHSKEIMQMDEFLRMIITEDTGDMKKDIILREAYNILTDYNSN